MSLRFPIQFRLALGILLAVLPVAVLGQAAASPPAEAAAAPVSPFNSGDIAWMLISTALVAMMTPAGLALFYGGMTPKRNVLNTVGMSYMAYAVGSVVWVIVGYTIAFSPTVGGWGLFGGLDRSFMAGVGVQDAHGTIPEVLYVAFQGTFAAIAVALISGSVIERVKFSAWLVFTVLWLVLVYSPVAHWVWSSEGFMFKWGVLDFAGGNVIHIAAGVSGLVFAILLGPRQETGLSVEAYSLKFTVLGSALLWFGWFGFNGGSELAADAIAANAVLVTNLSAAFGVIGWMLLEWLFTGRYTLFGAASGAVAGLVAITPASGYVNASASMIIGIMGGLIGYFGVYELKKRTKVDDALDAFGVHALVGFWGCIATGIFADPEVNPLGTGLWNGNADQLGVQALSAIIVVAFSAIMTVIVYYITKLLTRGVRVDAETERMGIDQSFHGESAGSA